MSIKGIVSNHLNFIHMPTGRYVFALKALGEEAERRGLDTLKAAADEAIGVGERALRLEFAYEQARTQSSNARGEAVQLDNQLDGQIGAIKALTDARAFGDEHDPVVQAARKILTVIFPRGAAPIIHQSFEVQLGTMDVMLEHLEGDLAGEVQLVGLEREVTRMRELVERFRAELKRAPDAAISFSEVRAAREELHEYASLVMIQALASYPSLDEQATRQRESLVAALIDQQERVRDDHRRRRNPADINPETGEERFEGDAPPADVLPPVVSDDVVEPSHV
ncbi:hypothetical protein FRC98_09535 [Lujinxingia vulgaris]|uniref:Uncharacterized protein n=1 Tax=Lujinxingia vulgaris TaxID=2600176 RepID=A0A5C6XDS8_9DELT|nr:hypothetical protein [Lujinxingia vulgaris]TXD36973.1 hypothetical protein FRC98_09535 [Lujinxingia vulgaris]